MAQRVHKTSYSYYLKNIVLYENENIFLKWVKNFRLIKHAKDMHWCNVRKMIILRKCVDLD